MVSRSITILSTCLLLALGFAACSKSAEFSIPAPKPVDEVIPDDDEGGGSGGGGGSAPSAYDAALYRSNAVSYGSNTISQGGHVEINGGKSNITFLIAVPDAGTTSSAISLANNLGGSLLNVVTVGSPVAFRSAKVNFYITGVNIGDNIAVYQVQGGKWVQLQTAEIRKDHVVVNMSQVGAVAFIRVPVLAVAVN